jgi:hypothetical protein
VLALQPEAVSRKLRLELRGILTAELCNVARGVVRSEAAALAQHGLLSESERAEARGVALREVCEPCARALLAEPGALAA